MIDFDLDPERDLILTRRIRATPAQVWRCWTEPEHLRQWWAPKPVETVHVELDLRPGGRFHTVMRTPDGSEFPTEGCYLEVVPHQRLVFTDTLEQGWRPAAAPFFTAILTITPEAGATRYTARAIHGTAENRAKHSAMGFEGGWGTALTQLEALALTL